MRIESWLGALRERNFRLYFVGQLTSAIGTGMTSVALAFAVLASDRSATALGVVLAANAVPLAVFLLVGGVIADRLGRRRVMLASDLMRGAAQAGLGAWVLIGHPPLWGFVLLAAMVGTATAFFMPALTGLIPEVVSTGRLAQANALDGLSNSIGSIAGPALAGVLVAAASPGWAIIADALSYFASVTSLALLRMPPTKMEAATSFFSQLRQGWSEFWSRTWLWVIVVQWSIGNAVILGPFFVLGAVVADRYLGGSTAWGTILAAQGAGSVAGGIVLLRLEVRRPLFVGTLSSLVFPWSLLALAFRAPLAVIAAGILRRRRGSCGLRCPVEHDHAARSAIGGSLQGQFLRLVRLTRLSSSWFCAVRPGVVRHRNTGHLHRRKHLVCRLGAGGRGRALGQWPRSHQTSRGPRYRAHVSAPSPLMGVESAPPAPRALVGCSQCGRRRPRQEAHRDLGRATTGSTSARVAATTATSAGWSIRHRSSTRSTSNGARLSGGPSSGRELARRIFSLISPMICVTWSSEAALDAALSASSASFRSTSVAGSIETFSRRSFSLTHHMSSWGRSIPGIGLPAPGRSSNSPRSIASRT